MSRGQVWVETVIYTLIGLSLIGLVLGLITPKINEYRDRAIIEQTIASLNVIDSKISEVAEAPGNVRVVSLTMRRGELVINASADMLVFVLEGSKVTYSEPGQPVQLGHMIALTTKAGSVTTVSLALAYPYDIDYDNNVSAKQFQAATTPYQLSFAHAGFSATANGTRPRIAVRELSGA